MRVLGMSTGNVLEPTRPDGDGFPPVSLLWGASLFHPRSPVEEFPVGNQGTGNGSPLPSRSKQHLSTHRKAGIIGMDFNGMTQRSLQFLCLLLASAFIFQPNIVKNINMDKKNIQISPLQKKVINNFMIPGYRLRSIYYVYYNRK